VPEDDREAVRWFRRAVAGGNRSALYNLGVMYANGDGVRRDDARAYLWLSVAAASADGIDREALEKVAARLSPTAREAADRLAAACRESAFKDCGEPKDP
jgi:TPR repeat protein